MIDNYNIVWLLFSGLPPQFERKIEQEVPVTLPQPQIGEEITVGESEYVIKEVRKGYMLNEGINKMILTIRVKILLKKDDTEWKSRSWDVEVVIF